MSEGEIRQNAQLYALVAEMHGVNAGIEGMKVANAERESQGYAMAYDEKSFNEAEKALCIIAERMRHEI